MQKLWVLVFILITAHPGSPQVAKQPGDLSGYRLSDLQVSGTTAFPREKLLAEFPIRAGDKADWSRIQKGLDRIKHMFGEAGYIDFKYTPWIDIDKKAKTVACSFDFIQGRQYTIHRLDLAGSSSLSDDKVRLLLTNLGLEEGKVFRLSLMDEAVKALNKLIGSEQFNSNSYAFRTSADFPGAVDVTIYLQPGAQ
jgi:outer membrane protein assembly factor BamA